MQEFLQKVRKTSSFYSSIYFYYVVYTKFAVACSYLGDSYYEGSGG